MRTDGVIDIKDGRHPLVERILTRDLFVPNDAHLDHKDCEIMLITGPNMAGKSTYMRQVALLTLMAQIGSFIPARGRHLAGRSHLHAHRRERRPRQRSEHLHGRDE